MVGKGVTMVYVLGSGSLHYNEELRFSLRTVQKYCPEVTRLIVAGEQALFLSDKVEYLPIKEAQGNKEYRIAMKVFEVCNYIKGDFLFMNDDFFFLRPTNLENYPNYSKGDLKATQQAQHYQKAIQDTQHYLKELGHTTHHFDVHTPIIYNAKKFQALLPHFEKSRLSTNGFVVKSLYGNIYNLEPTQIVDCKLTTLQTQSDYRKLESAVVMSCSDGSWMNGVRNYLKNSFQNKSKYEN